MIGPIQKYSVKGIYQLFRYRLSQIFVCCRLNVQMIKR